MNNNNLPPRTGPDYFMEVCLWLVCIASGLYFFSKFLDTKTISDWYWLIAFFLLFIVCLIFIYFHYITVDNLDRKYLRKLLSSPDRINFLPTGIILTREELFKIKLIRARVYLRKSKKGKPIYELRKKAIPEFSYSEIKLIDKILIKIASIAFILCCLFIFLAHGQK